MENFENILPTLSNKELEKIVENIHLEKYKRDREIEIKNIIENIKEIENLLVKNNEKIDWEIVDNIKNISKNITRDNSDLILKWKQRKEEIEKRINI